MELKDAVKKIRKDPATAKAFMKSPTKTLKGLGVDTSKLAIHKHAPDAPKGATHGACVSAGCGACASAG
ncbi:MAG TPA: hypothetical protein VM943_00530 [Pyrinomonadaceae bacterium]|nr:hypothetical protein [Pyrinomonadaceae bacterium]